jgi:PAS domain S-box-containing protein
MQKHRNVLLELAQADKSDFRKALQQICSTAAGTLDIARVGYWSLQDNGAAIVCELLYLHNAQDVDAGAEGTRLAAAACPDYFAALATKRPIAAADALAHPATAGLSSYLNSLGIGAMLDAPVWVGGEVVGVLCHEHVGPPREWSAEEVDFASALSAMVSIALEESKRARSERLLRESEAKFRALFEASSQGVILQDEERLLQVNPACVRIFGYRAAEEIVGKHPADLSPPLQPNGESSRAAMQKHIRECMSRGHTRFDWVNWNGRREEVHLDVILTRIELGGRQVIQAMVSDISERKRAEAELRKALAHEKELNQIKGGFVSMVSHEFRTPLGIIQSSSEILRDYLEQLGPDERREQLDSIVKSTRRMAAMMEDILVLSRFDAGRMEFKPARVNLDGFCQNIVGEVLSATERRCPIEWSLQSRALEVRADERLLGHIFTNLLSNAVKYSEPGRTVHFLI